jgi:hypothetical protein
MTRLQKTYKPPMLNLLCCAPLGNLVKIQK